MDLNTHDVDTDTDSNISQVQEKVRMNNDFYNMF